VTPLYHITDVRNLAGILGAGGLWGDARRPAGAVSIAHEHIKARRRARAVQTLRGRRIAVGGHLCDYVPFYFAPRSPMLFTIHRGNVPQYPNGQRGIIHLVTSVKRATGTGRAWCFTDGHAEMGLSEFSDDLADLDRLVDWPTMQGDFWNDTVDQPDRKRRRQAEFLVHEFYPWSAFRRIGVHDDDVRRQVEALLAPHEHRPEVAVERGWYY
jgi:hypothetical protein